jgi:hypothetical protein
MKIYWWLGLTRTYAMHAAVCELQRRYGWKEHAAYVVGRDPYDFLRQQQDVHYQILDEHDQIFIRYRETALDPTYLDQIEQEYGLPSLWPYAYADRHLTAFTHHDRYSHKPFSHDDICRAIQNYFQYYLDVFERFQPDVVIAYAVASTPALIVYHIARNRGIPFLFPVTARIHDRYLIATDPYEQWAEVRARYQELLAGQNSPREAEARRILEDFRAAPVAPQYTSLANRVVEEREVMTGRKASRWLSDLVKSWTGKYEQSYRVVHPLQRAEDWFRFKWRIRQLRRPGFFEKPRDDESYAFFPLHVAPEASTMILAPMYLDQPALIEQISQSLPINFKLYVKEHIPMLGRRPLTFYERIRRLPNVRLIDPRTRSFDLIASSRLITTITGTVGWEALQLGKPVVTFGHVFFNMVPLVRHVTDTAQLPRAIHEQLANYQYDESQVVKLLAALLELSFPFESAWFWGKWPAPEAMMARQDQVKILASALAHAVEKAVGKQ